ncbi:MAG: nucleotidyltransferase domain-containing protein [Acidimicrobiia bacterium]
MDLARPYADVLPGPRGAALAALAALEKPVTVRALAREATVSPQGALRLVNELAGAGLVTVEPAGRALMVALNRDHLAVEAIVALLSIRSRLVGRLREKLAVWPGLAGAWLFGSAARGDGGAESDIDVLMVGDKVDSEAWDRATARLADQVQRWTGNPLQLVEHTRESFSQLVKRRNRLIASLRREGIALTDEAEQLLRGAA